MAKTIDFKQYLEAEMEETDGLPCVPPPVCETPPDPQWWCFDIQAKGAYLWPTNQTISKIYGGGGIYGLEMGVQWAKYLYGWVDANYFIQSGRTLGAEQFSTYMILIPGSLGFSLTFPLDLGNIDVVKSFIKRVQVGGGIGVEGTYVYIHNSIAVGPTKTSRGAVGFVARANILFDIPRHWFLNIFGTYSYRHLHAMDLSDGTLGLGLGYTW